MTVARSAPGVADPGAVVVRAGAERTALSHDPAATPGRGKPVMRKACSVPEVGWISAAVSRGR